MKNIPLSTVSLVSRLYLLQLLLGCLILPAISSSAQTINPVPKASIHGGATLAFATSVQVSGHYAYVVGGGRVLDEVIGNNTFEIIDINVLSAPVHKGSLTDGAGGAKLKEPYGVSILGNYAYVASYGSDALEIIDITTPAAPAHKGSITNGDGGALLENAYAVSVVGNYAYVAGINFEIVDITNPAVPVHKGSLTGTSTPEGLAYQSVYVSGNYAYLVGTSTNALQIIDISNPAAPKQVGIINDGQGGALLNAGSSVVVAGAYAYVASGGSNALEIVDVSNPAAPVHKNSLIDGASGAKLFGPTGVSVSGNYAYVTSFNSDALEVVDITDPAVPAHYASLGSGITAAPWLDLPSSICIVGTNAFITSYRDNALEIIDISTPAVPAHKGSILDGDVVPAGSGALMQYPTSIFTSGNYAYVTSVNSKSLEIIDISTPTTPVHKGSLTDGTGGAYLNNPNCVYVSGNYAYVASLSSQHLEIIDVSDPTTPVHKAALNDFPICVFVSGNYAYVGSNSFEIVDVTDPTNPVSKALISSGTPNPVLSFVSSIYVVGDIAYVTSQGGNALEILNISNKTNPVHLGKLTDGTGGALLNSPRSVYVVGNYAYVVSTGSNALEIVNVSDPTTPVHVASITGNTLTGVELFTPLSVTVVGNYALVASQGSHALEIVDITNPLAPVHRASVIDGQDAALLRGASSVSVSGNYAYVTSQGRNAVEVIYLYAPVPPIATAATAIQDISFTANWNASAAATGYYLDVSTSDKFSTLVINNLAVGNVTSYLATGVASGATYYYRIRAISSTGTSDNSNTITAHTTPPPPVFNAPIGITQSSFVLSWNFSNTAIGYYLDMSTSNTFATFVDGYNNLTVNNTNINTGDATLSPATTYYLRIRAYNSYGTSGNSSTLSVTTLAKLNQTITLDSARYVTLGDSPVTLSGFTSSSLSITYVSSNTTLATIAGNIVTIKARGITTIKATQPGNSTYNAADIVSQTLHILNVPPVAANPITQQAATQSSSFTFRFSGNTFSDADHDSLTYTARQSDGTSLPAWLNFTSSTRTFSGTPGSTDNTLIVQVIANDGFNGIATTNFTIVIAVVNGVEESSIFTKAYPNPVHQTLFIESGSGNNNTGLAIWSVMGNVVYRNTGTSQQEQIDVSQWANGLYVIELKTADAVYRTKIIKN